MTTRSWANDQPLRHGSPGGMKCRPTRPVAQPAIAPQTNSVVASQDRGLGTSLGGEAVQLADKVLAGNAALDHSSRTLAGVLIDDGCDLDRPAVGGDVELEVHSPHAVGRIRGHDRSSSSRGAVAFLSSPLRRSQAFLAPNPLNLLVIDDRAFAAGIMVGGPEPATGMILRILTQPHPQCGVVSIRRG